MTRHVTVCNGLVCNGLWRSVTACNGLVLRRGVPRHLGGALPNYWSGMHTSTLRFKTLTLHLNCDPTSSLRLETLLGFRLEGNALAVLTSLAVLAALTELATQCRPCSGRRGR